MRHTVFEKRPDPIFPQQFRNHNAEAETLLSHCTCTATMYLDVNAPIAASVDMTTKVVDHDATALVRRVVKIAPTTEQLAKPGRRPDLGNCKT